jgi:hypothetical protein
MQEQPFSKEAGPRCHFKMKYSFKMKDRWASVTFPFSVFSAL